MRDIPGTFIFDGKHSMMGYQLNKMCMSLNKEPNRDEFRADEAAYCAKFDLSAEQTQAVLDRQWLRMLELGGNIYYTFKLAIFDGLSMQDVGGAMSGVSEEEFRNMMIAGGRVGNAVGADGVRARLADGAN